MDIQTHKDHLIYARQYLKIEQAVHAFLEKKGYLKVELPVLSPALVPESYVEVFETEFRYFDNTQKLYLIPSPELFLKRLVSYGVGSCYYLGKSFRNNDPNTPLHSFEFVMLEYYKEHASYMDIADELLELLQYIASKSKITYQGKTISLEKWEKISVSQAFDRYTHITEKELFDHTLFINMAKEKGYRTDGFSYEDIWSQVYVAEIEPHLGQNGYPTLIYDYPKEFAALCKLNEDNKTSQRFEFYINGIELGDCYAELTDWKEQDKRFTIEQKKRKKEGKILHPIDKGFIQALQYGLPDCAGIAIGFERLAMIFCDVDSIEKLKLISIG